MASTSDSDASPIVTRDPRFKAGRSLVQKGMAHGGAIEIFSSLVEEAVHKYGEASIETGPYYEYGNALLRALGTQSQGDGEEVETSPKEAAAAAAEKRATKAHAKQDDEQEQQNEEDTSDGDDDALLGLEMMENAYSILDTYKHGTNEKYQAWTTLEIPRVLLGIGDVLSTINRHADAADAYSRALEHFQEILKGFSSEDSNLAHLKAHRKVCEATILIAEELLSCHDGEDVITTETKSLIVSASERIEYARGYYDQAREALQETLFFMANLAALGIDVQTEKEDTCFLATMIMGVGTTLAAIDEEKESATTEPVKKKAKT